MNATMKKIVGLTAAAVLAASLIVLAGCASSGSGSAASKSGSAASTSASAASTSASAASTSASATSASASAASASAAAQSASAASESASAAAASSESSEIANPWKQAASAEEAAAGAGIESFNLPEGEVAGLGTPFEITYRYMDGMAEAQFSFAASAVTARTAKIGPEDTFDISGDYNNYTYEWTEYIDNSPIACAGNREGDSIKTFWGEDGVAHSLVAQGLGGDTDFGLNAERLTVFVEAMN